VSRWTSRRPPLRLSIREGGWRLHRGELTLAEGELPRANDHDALVAAVQAIEASAEQRASLLHVTVPDRWVQSFDVSPPREVSGLAELQQFAEVRRNTLFGGPDESRKAVANWRAAEPFVAVAMPGALVDALHALCRRQGWRLASVLPRWADAISRRSRRDNSSWLAVADGSVVTLVHHRAGRAKWVRTQVTALTATQEDARRLLARSALAVQGLPPAHEFEWVVAADVADRSSDRRVVASAYNFANSPSPWRRPAATTSALLGACALFTCTLLALAGAQWSALRGEQRLLTATIDAAVTANAPRKAAKATGPAPEQVGAAKQLVALLDAPWMPWLRAFEASAHPDMTLLSLEIDATARHAHGSALARTPQAMLAYIDRLGELGAPGAPRLLRHDTADKVPGAPLRFEFGSVAAASAPSR
jgi:hypothetical protein